MHRYNKKPIEIGRLQRYAMDRFYAQPRAAAAPAATRRQRRGGLHRRRPGVAGLRGGTAAARLRGHGLRQPPAARRAEYLRRRGVQAAARGQPARSGTGAVAGRGVPAGGGRRRRSRWRIWSASSTSSSSASGWARWSGWAFRARNCPGVIDALRFIERYKTLPDFQVGRRGDRDRRRQYRDRRGQRGACGWARRRSICSTGATEKEMPAFSVRVRSLQGGGRAVPLAGAAGGDRGARRPRGGGEVRARRGWASPMRAGAGRPEPIPGTRVRRSRATW